MAWTDQCKVAFRASAEHFVWQQEKETKKGLWKVLGKLSEQSGIPRITLYKWWKEEEEKREKNIQDVENESTFKNESNEATNENNSENETQVAVVDVVEEIPICIRCGKAKVEIKTATKKPVTKESKYFGLCSRCRKKQKAMETLDQEATKDDGVLAICPKCNHSFYINQERIDNGIGGIK